MAWNVKKDIPIGKGSSLISILVFKKLLIFSIKKPLYLKYPNIAILTMTENHKTIFFCKGEVNLPIPKPNK